MLKPLMENFSRYTIEARNESAGKVKDFYFSEDEWKVRHVVVDTGKWLPGRKVLLSTASVEEADEKSGIFRFPVSKDRIKESPSWDSKETVSRRREAELFRYYEWQPYWTGTFESMPPVPGAAAGFPAAAYERPSSHDEEGPGLRSAKEVTGYGIEASDGNLGKLSDFIVDPETWNIRYFIADTHKWLPGRKVILSPQWIERVSWEGKQVFVNLTKEEVKKSPEYDPLKLDRDYEQRLYGHYGRELTRRSA